MAGPICSGVSCWPLALAVWMQYIWVPIAVVCFLVAGARWRKKGFDRIFGLFIVLGLAACLGYIPIYQRTHAYDAQTQSAMDQIGDSFYWTETYPPNWSLQRVTGSQKDDGSDAYVLASFYPLNGEVTMHQYRDDPQEGCGYYNPEVRVVREYKSSKNEYVERSTRIASEDCVLAFTREDGVKVYRDTAPNTGSRSYFLSSGELHVTITAGTGDEKVEQFIRSLKLVAGSELPLGVHES